MAINELSEDFEQSGDNKNNIKKHLEIF